MTGTVINFEKDTLWTVSSEGLVIGPFEKHTEASALTRVLRKAGHAASIDRLWTKEQALATLALFG